MPINPEIADRLLNMAIEDLDSSIILNNRKHYPQAVYLLQQSVEKAAKSLGFFFKIIDSKDSVGYIGHWPLRLINKTTDIFADGIRQIRDYQDDMPEVRQYFADVGVDIAAFVEEIERHSKGLDKSLKSLEQFDLSAQDIRSLFKQLSKQSTEIESILSRLEKNGLTDADYEEMKKKMGEIFIFAIGSLKLSKEKKAELLASVPMRVTEVIPPRDIIEYFLKLLFMFVWCCSNLFYLTIIIGPHEARTRYPDERDRFDPLDYYDAYRPIVAAMPELFKHTRQTLEKIDNLYDLYANLIVPNLEEEPHA